MYHLFIYDDLVSRPLSRMVACYHTCLHYATHSRLLSYNFDQVDLVDQVFISHEKPYQS